MKFSHRLSTPSDGSLVRVSLVLQGLFVAFVLMFTFSILLTLVTTLSHWEESKTTLNLFNYTSILIGALFVGRNCDRRVWLNGALVGLGYLLILTGLKGDMQLILNVLWFQQLFVVTFVGLLGGVLGGLFDYT